eukprot:435526-Rhodomonas_salina.1
MTLRHRRASSIAGLEVHNAEQGWVRPEAACPRDDRTVIVMPEDRQYDSASIESTGQGPGAFGIEWSS